MDIKHQKDYLQHYVLFWLKPDLTEIQISNFKEFFEPLKSIKSVKRLTYGLAAPTEKRAVTDNSFSYSLTVVFSSMQDHEAYQNDQIHLEAIAKFSKYWHRVVVHDTLIS